MAGGDARSARRIAQNVSWKTDHPGSSSRALAAGLVASAALLLLGPWGIAFYPWTFLALLVLGLGALAWAAPRASVIGLALVAIPAISYQEGRLAWLAVALLAGVALAAASWRSGLGLLTGVLLGAQGHALAGAVVIVVALSSASLPAGLGLAALSFAFDALFAGLSTFGKSAVVDLTPKAIALQAFVGSAGSLEYLLASVRGATELLMDSSWGLFVLLAWLGAATGIRIARALPRATARALVAGLAGALPVAVLGLLPVLDARALLLSLAPAAFAATLAATLPPWRFGERPPLRERVPPERTLVLATEPARVPRVEETVDARQR